MLGTQFHSHNELTFGRNSFQDICLQTTQHVRTQYIMKFLDLIFFSNIFKLCQKTVLAPKNNLKQTTVLSGLSWSMYGGFVKVPKLWFHTSFKVMIWRSDVVVFLYLASLDSTCYVLLAAYSEALMLTTVRFCYIRVLP